MENPHDASAFFSPEAHLRLRAIKTLYDPEHTIRGNHPVRPFGNDGSRS